MVRISWDGTFRALLGKDKVIVKLGLVLVVSQLIGAIVFVFQSFTVLMPSSVLGCAGSVRDVWY